MRRLILILFISSFFFSCTKPEKYDTTPTISYIDIPAKDTVDQLGNPIKRCVLTFSLIDGDGDIGFKEGDTLAPFDIHSVYYNNLIIDMYKIVDGNTILVDTPEIKNYFRFRTNYIEPIGQNKTLKCTIYVDLNIDMPSSWDSVWFDFYMYDRALNKSNTASTTLLVLH
jgi:hypothetical protein